MLSDNKKQQEPTVEPIVVSPKQLKIVCIIEWAFIAALSYGCLTLLSKALMGFS